jgi:hypothetical protein
MKLTRRILLAALIAGPALAQGAKVASSYEARVLALKPGEFIWDGEIAPQGPIMVIINLTTQRAFVYRNGIRIGASTISSGKPGKRTPTGVFQILQKNKDHRSNLYNNAPMPYMQRLTWDGIALHAGHLPGYPASHGCIRLPMEFARELYQSSPMGMTVVVMEEAVTPESVSEAAILAPRGPKGEALGEAASPLDERAVSRWTPERAPEGPVTIVLTTANERIIVYRNGVEIGRSRIEVPKDFEIGTRAAQFAGRDANGQAQWIYLAMSSYQERAGQAVEMDAINKVKIPPIFLAHLRDIIGEGTTLLATDGGLLGGSTGKQLTVLANE